MRNLSTITKENFTRVKNDINGNPRYVLHFLDIKHEKSTKPFDIGYNSALSNARQFGGKKYRGKDFGGGIIFCSYNLQDLCDLINTFNNN